MVDLTILNYTGQYEYIPLNKLYLRKKKLSFCITCMNRLWQIKETLPVNLRNNRYQHDDIEFIVADFGTPGLPDWIHQNFRKELASGYLRYRQFKHLDSWHASIAKNISHHLGIGEIVVNLDCDNYTGPFGGQHIIKVFQNSGNDTIFHQWSGQDRDGTYGRISMKKTTFLSLGGYDESFLPMGYQDHDLILRHQGLYGEKEMISYQKWKSKYPHNQKYSHLQEIYSNAIENDKEASTQNTNSSYKWGQMNQINREMSEANIQQKKWVANQ